VLVVDLAGRVTGQGSEGFYVENTRLLSRHELTVDRRPLEPVAASPVGGSALLAYAQAPEGPTVPRRAVAFEMASFVGEGLREVLRIENYSARETARFALGIHLAADFADIEEAQQGRRQQTADVETCWDAARQELRFRYTHPCLDWAVVIRIEQAPAPVRICVFLSPPLHRSAERGAGTASPGRAGVYPVGPPPG
jgi:glycogen debranching enzyme-like protein